ncbi:Adrenodoxin-like protein 1, mitochondrial [Smittium culicis]|uniref:2Fe-2S ferredoxin n=1 Tax=Smittium culicis TaxID=133412 RepID=A0A1R1X6W7_9FUNG|nr:Adrenodoxin-like protein 1, mitochondrial [Smittium culicis]
MQRVSKSILSAANFLPRTNARLLRSSYKTKSDNLRTGRLFSTRACECSCACSTCHVILESELYDKLEEPTDEELDMLDLAFGLTETSRLGCQIQASKLLEGAKIKLPSATRNFYVDGSKPTHH